ETSQSWASPSFGRCRRRVPVLYSDRLKDHSDCERTPSLRPRQPLTGPFIWEDLESHTWREVATHVEVMSSVRGRRSIVIAGIQPRFMCKPWRHQRLSEDDSACDQLSRSRRHHQCRQWQVRSEEHTSELQSLAYLVCRLLLE